MLALQLWRKRAQQPRGEKTVYTCALSGHVNVLDGRWHGARGQNSHADQAAAAAGRPAQAMLQNTIADLAAKGAAP